MAARKRLSKAKNVLLAKVYKAAVRGEPWRELHRDLMRTTLREGYYPDQALLTSAVRMAKSLCAKARKADGAGLAVAPIVVRASDALQAVVNSSLESEANAAKGRILADARAKAVGEGRVFMLASEHGDCAEDHEPYQGRMYIVDGWRSAADPQDLGAIEDYVKRHRVGSFDAVTKGPAWLITRPYCRHYFKPLSPAEAIGHSPAELIGIYNMRRAVGQRGAMQTLPSRGREAKAMAEAYSGRIDLLERMMRVKSDPTTMAALRKARLLKKKWAGVLKEQKAAAKAAQGGGE